MRELQHRDDIDRYSNTATLARAVYYREFRLQFSRVLYMFSAVDFAGTPLQTVACHGCQPAL
jgi:hypothetical protein